jgi:hypothetical protein
MRKIREAFQSSAFALVIAGIAGINVIAQEKKQEGSSTNVLRAEGAIANVATVPMIAPALPLGRGFGMGALGFGPYGIVKNAPFSAELVFESVQTLNDGNRIVQRSSTLMYRDSQGRTRSEHTYKPFFQLGGENAEHKTIIIFDSVSGINYTLDPQTRTAHKIPTFQPANSLSEAAALAPKLRRVEGGGGSQGKKLIDIACVSPPNSLLGAPCNNESSSKHESLGKQMIEGVEAEGARITHTIPAGAMGNERAIEFFQERWHSKELEMDLMTKWFDPRVGETTNRLTNLNRSEPDASLFQPPPDYTIREVEMPNALIMKGELEKKLREKNREQNNQ